MIEIILDPRVIICTTGDGIGKVFWNMPFIEWKNVFCSPGGDSSRPAPFFILPALTGKFGNDMNQKTCLEQKRQVLNYQLFSFSLYMGLVEIAIHKPHLGLGINDTFSHKIRVVKCKAKIRFRTRRVLSQSTLPKFDRFSQRRNDGHVPA